MNIKYNQAIIAISIIFVLAFGVLVLYPKYQELEAMNKIVAGKTERIEKSESYFQKISEINKKLKGYQGELEKIDLLFDNDVSLPDLYDYFYTVSSQSGLVVASISHKEEQKEEAKSPVSSQDFGLPSGLKLDFEEEDLDISLQEREISFDLSLAGSFRALENFLDAVERSSLLFTVENISFDVATEEGKTQSFKVSLKLNVFN